MMIFAMHSPVVISFLSFLLRVMSLLQKCGSEILLLNVKDLNSAINVDPPSCQIADQTISISQFRDTCQKV
jgi:hypothetical protein